MIAGLLVGLKLEMPEEEPWGFSLLGVRCKHLSQIYVAATALVRFPTRWLLVPAILGLHCVDLHLLCPLGLSHPPLTLRGFTPLVPFQVQVTVRKKGPSRSPVPL